MTSTWEWDGQCSVGIEQHERAQFRGEERYGQTRHDGGEWYTELV